MSYYITGEWGDDTEITVEESVIEITTLSVEEKGTETATLRANVDDLTLNEGEEANLWFRYRQVGDSTWAITEPEIEVVETGEQTQSVAGLNDGVEYEAEARAQIDDGDVVSGGLITFETVEAEEEYSFSGVVEDDVASPVEGATVELSIDGSFVGEDTTDSEGAYDISHTSQPSDIGSEATVEASSQDYVTNSETFDVDSETTSYTQDVVIERQPKISVQLLSVDNITGDSATLRAETDATNVENVEAKIDYREQGSTNVSGGSWQPGTGEIERNISGLDYATTYERIATVRGDGVEDEQTEWESFTTDEEETETYIFDGVIQDNDGPLENASVNIHIDGAEVGQDITDGDGVYTIQYDSKPSELGAEATVEASLDEYITNSETVALDGETTAYSQDVMLEKEPTLSVALLSVNDITDESATVRAEVEATNVSNVETRLDYREGSSGTVNEGVWQPGEGVIERSISGLLPETMYERRAVSRGDEVDDETTAWESFQTSAEDEEVYSFDGIIEGTEGPIQGAIVTLSIDSVQIGEQTTGSDGAYSFSHSQQPSELGQEATIEVAADEYDGETETIPLDSTVMTYLLDFTLSLSPALDVQSLDDSDITEDSATLRGQVDAVNVNNVEARIDYRVAGSSSISEGGWQASSGEVTRSVSGLEPETLYEKKILARGDEVDEKETGWITFETLPEEKETYTISGEVSSETGSLLPSASVTLFIDGAEIETTTTASDGTYNFQHTSKPSELGSQATVEASADSYETGSESVQLQDNITSYNLDITLAEEPSLAVSTLSAQDITDDSATVRGEVDAVNVTNLQHRIDYRVAGDSSINEGSWESGGGEVQRAISGLVSGVQYEFRVLARGDEVNDEQTTWSLFETEPPPLGDATDAATVIGTIGRKYYEGQRVPFTFSFRDANGPASPGFPITFRVSNRSGEVIDTHEFTSDDMEDGDTRLTFTYVLPAYGTMRFSVQSADGIVDVIRQYVHPNPA